MTDRSALATGRPGARLRRDERGEGVISVAMATV